jgi:AcrR family transcriptional regulator
MDSAAPRQLLPRKKPRQARSEVTVEAMLEATIQVLLSHGATRLTTTRVAERAGVSVGSIYQYFPDKQALLCAVLLRHFEAMAAAIESACADAESLGIADLADRIAAAYAGVKIARPAATRALYHVAGAIAVDKVSTGIHLRLEEAIAGRLAQADDARFADPGETAFVLMAALSGLTRAVFQRDDPTPERIALYRREAATLTRAYLAAAAR